MQGQWQDGNLTSTAGAGNATFRAGSFVVEADQVRICEEC